MYQCNYHHFITSIFNFQTLYLYVLQKIFIHHRNITEQLDGPAVSALWRLIAKVKLRWSQLHLHSLAPTNPHWAHVVGFSPFSLCVFHKEGLCFSIGDINRPMMMRNTIEILVKFFMNIRSWCESSDSWGYQKKQFYKYISVCPKIK
jgi:hypothetical protein